MITIVSGLPRSGTSLLMQMLAAGGIPILTDGERAPDTDNPRGYYEWERIKQLPRDPGCIADAEGKVVKVISQLLLSLPQGRDYRVIFMQRPLPEVLASQDEMIRHRGTTGGQVSETALTSAMRSHLQHVDAWLAGRPDIKTLRLLYGEVLSDPLAAATHIQKFLQLGLDVEAMARQVDPSLYRNRR